MIENKKEKKRLCEHFEAAMTTMELPPGVRGGFRVARLTSTMMPWPVVSVASAAGKELTDISQGGRPYLRAQALGLFTGRITN